MKLLEVQNLRSGYGPSDVLHGTSLTVREGQVVSLVGANGAGKTTMLRTISRMLKARTGSIVFDGQDLLRLKPHDVITKGLVHVPQGRHLFPDLTVRENLLLGAARRGSRDTRQRLDDVEELFPVLGERRDQTAKTLSGGEQQMCAIGRGLMGNPRLLVLDEPSEGLAPVVVDRVFGVVSLLRQRGLTVLLVEQSLRRSLEVSDYGYVIERGKISSAGPSSEIAASAETVRAFLGVDEGENK